MTTMTTPIRPPEPLLLLAGGAAALLVSVIHPYDMLTWWMEVAPILLAVPILAATWRRFRFTPLVYRLLLLHALILMLGAHYTYERVPLGEWAKEVFHFTRNHYDRIGHLAQGFVPALVVRELLLRTSPLRRGKWLFFLVTSVCLAASACYEFIEWWTAAGMGQSAEAFLGSQGDIWDAQKDMLMALIGALLGQLLLGGVQDRELEELDEEAARKG